MNHKIPLILIALGIVATLAVGTLRNKSVGPDPLQQLKERYAKKAVPSVDHTKLAIFAEKNFLATGSYKEAIFWQL